jgi:hypothetical protein
VHVIKGKVMDARGPLSGVLVKVQGAMTGVYTNAEGSYAIPISNASQADQTLLIFKSFGYKTQAILVRSHKTNRVILLPQSQGNNNIPFLSPELKTDKGGVYTETA